MELEMNCITNKTHYDKNAMDMNQLKLIRIIVNSPALPFLIQIQNKNSLKLKFYLLFDI